jgi:hypothetical protein
MDRRVGRKSDIMSMKELEAMAYYTILEDRINHMELVNRLAEFLLSILKWLVHLDPSTGQSIHE